MSIRIAGFIAGLVLAIAIITNVGAGQADPKQNDKEQARQNQPLQLKTELIDLRAVVTDKRGQPISGLKKENFEVQENGKRQEIALFAAENIPVTAPDTARTNATPSAKNAPVAPNQIVPPAASATRSVLLFVDTLSMTPGNFLSMRQALSSFVDQKITETDLVALIPSAGSQGLVQQFTQNRQILRYAISKLAPNSRQPESQFTAYLSSMILRGDQEALDFGIQVLRTEDHIDAPRNIMESYTRSKAMTKLAEATYQRKAALAILKASIASMSGLPGQRLVVLLSDGFTLLSDSGGLDSDELNAVTTSAVRSGVVIYSIDTNGLRPPSIFSASQRGLSSSSSPGTPGRPGRSAPTQSASPGSSMNFASAAEKDLQDGINFLANETGGKAFLHTNDIKGSLQNALDSNRIYYSLAYYPPDENNEKKFRKITVSVKNHPEYQVRAQKGYLPADLKAANPSETAGAPEQRVARALMAPLPVTAVALAAEAVYLETEVDDAQVSVKVAIEGGHLEFAPHDQQYALDLDLGGQVFDSSGKSVNSFGYKIQGNLDAAKVALARQGGYEYTQRLTLKPGLYQIRAIVRDKNADRIGTAFAWVEVPDLTRKKLAISDVIISKDPSNLVKPGETTSKQAVQSSGDALVVHLKRNEKLDYVYMVYNSPQGSNDLQIQTTVLQGDRSVYQGSWHVLNDYVMKSDKKGLVVGGQINLDPLKPGPYQLQVTLKDPKSKQQVVRLVNFAVE